MVEVQELMKMLKLRLLMWEMHVGYIIILQQKSKLDNIDHLKFFLIFEFFLVNIKKKRLFWE